MCGIAGELRLTPGERPSRDRVRAMCDVMVHRGPDSFGEYANDPTSVCFEKRVCADRGATQADTRRENSCLTTSSSESATRSGLP